MSKKERQQKLIEKLERLRNRASDARDKFIQELEKAKSRKDWDEVCGERGIYPQADWGDWMA